jgi:hypothetical protein
MKAGLSARRWVAAFLIAMAAAHAVVAWKERPQIARGYGDFSSLYTSGLMVRCGLGHRLYDRREQWRLQQGLFPEVAIRRGPIPFMRPPFEALFLAGFSYFAYTTALAIWSAVKLALLWLTLWILKRSAPLLSVYPVWAETILCLGLFPMFLDFYQGQDAVLLLFLVALAFRSLTLERDGMAGLYLGLALFKFHLTLPLVMILVLAGRRRVLAGFVPTALALMGVSCAIAGPSVLYLYPAYLLKLNHDAGAGMVTAQSMPNLRGLLTTWVGSAPYPGPIHWALLPAALAAMGYTAWAWKRKSKAGMAALVPGFSLALAATLLTSYYAYCYDMTLLIVPLLLVGGGFLARGEMSPSTRKLLSAAALLLICTPLYWALSLRLNLLCLPMLLLAAGLILALKATVPATS